jgi:hypothetical protein
VVNNSVRGPELKYGGFIMMSVLFFLLFSVSAEARFGAATLECSAPDIELSAGNGSNLIHINFIDKETREAGVYEAPIRVMPGYGHNTELNSQTVTAVPFSPTTLISEENLVMHVFKLDGTDCYGRESWDTIYRQDYVLTGAESEPLQYASGLIGKEVRGMNREGYLVANFHCRDSGLTSAGGCYVEEGDRVVWEPIKND